ncbi:TIGR03862 family flavoprotein [Catenovulum sp. 2E275]|uniref:TIGR03862 family flavoprotein n=1 Tax=Catenovulum sp. 2E275 TaxID=2980497 RepID=UPI0021D33D0D|nr:TIGR03862 family flavoprotein [Catenovulum sp. 2E275]MCU4675286.1 TIGR03862 family flavoprotein [Catenovulum sp. 2E275]
MNSDKVVVVVGAGPAGLMAAEVISQAGFKVKVFDAKPSAGRKFLLAGVGGMNITHSEPYPQFITRYYEKSQWLSQAISQFTADDIQAWMKSLGIDSFTGSSGRVFPQDMKAAPLLRNWLKNLRDNGVEFYPNHKLIALAPFNLHDQSNGYQLSFINKAEPTEITAQAVVLALGGASWPKLGSDGKWFNLLTDKGVSVHKLQSANCGFYCNWSTYLQNQFAGTQLKNIALHFTAPNGEKMVKKGECIVTKDGFEGSLFYAFSKYLRDAINQTGQANITIDLIPDLSFEQICQKLSNKKPKESFNKYLKRSIALNSLEIALLFEKFDKTQLHNIEYLARAIQQVPVTLTQVKPIEEAISSAGGVCQSSVNHNLMLTALPGIFCAGEMLDWEAPTGGYLLTACFATGRLAATGVCDFLSNNLNKQI